MLRLILLCVVTCGLALADIRVWTGSFTQGATTVTTSDGAGSFAPKVLICSYTDLTAPGAIAGARHGLGFWSSNGPSRGMVWGEANDTGGATANTSNKRNTFSNRAIAYYNGNTAVADATITATGTGFTMSWGTNDSTARIINCQALGGSDIVNSKVVQISTPGTATTLQTTVGFQPTIVFMGFATTVVLYPNLPSNNFTFSLGVGLGTDPATSGAMGSQSVDNASTSVSNSIEVAHPLQITPSGSGTTFASADISAIDSTSWTYNFSVSGVSSAICLAIQGGTWAVGRRNQPTSTGNDAITVTGVHPVGAMFFSANKVTSGSHSTHVRNSFGATDGTNNFNVWWGQKGGGATVQVASTSMDQTNPLQMMTEGGASPTTQATMDSVAFADNTLTTHWSAADATAREYVYVTVGTVAAGGGSAAVKHKVTNQ